MTIKQTQSETSCADTVIALKEKFCIGYGPRGSTKMCYFDAYLDTGRGTILIDMASCTPANQNGGESGGDE